MSGDINYKILKNTWIVSEEYAPKITMSLPEWRKYSASGMKVIEQAGGVIPSGTIQTGFGGSGAVYKGNVRQNWGARFV
jgi:hypothetical protein